MQPIKNQVQEKIRLYQRFLTKISWKELLIIALCAFLAIGAISFLSLQYQAPLFMASFGASSVLLFAVPQSAFSQPKNLIGGHLFSALIGISCYQIGGETWYMLGLAATLAILVMVLTQTIHPPGGATALICLTQHCSYSFVLTPVLAGAVILVLIFFLGKFLRRKFLAESEN